MSSALVCKRKVQFHSRPRGAGGAAVARTVRWLRGTGGKVAYLVGIELVHIGSNEFGIINTNAD